MSIARGQSRPHPAAAGPERAQGFAAVTWLVVLGLTSSLLAMAVGLFG